MTGSNQILIFATETNYEISYSELIKYVQKKMVEFGFPQHPQLEGNAEKKNQLMFVELVLCCKNRVQQKWGHSERGDGSWSELRFKLTRCLHAQL